MAMMHAHTHTRTHTQTRAHVHAHSRKQSSACVCVYIELNPRVLSKSQPIDFDRGITPAQLVRYLLGYLLGAVIDSVGGALHTDSG